MSDAHPELGDPTRNLLHLIGEAISEDVSAWDWLDDWTLIVTRGGRTFVVRAHPEGDPESRLETVGVTVGGAILQTPRRKR